IEAALERGRQALKQEDYEEMRSATEGINQTVQQAAQQMYSRAEAAGGAEGAGAGPGAGFRPGAETEPASEEAAAEEEEVVEADYEIVEEEK
ncbi:MAG: molecular chaperone DnaK, partial [Gemmatimonadota bacterium]|nr:molecular chaperone DnaK [Gemmatimonadota bacterium]